MIEIAFTSENDQLVEANLEGYVFYIHLAWNESLAAYTLGLSTPENENLIEGVAVVTGYPLLFRYRYSYMPKGDFYVYTAKGNEPLRNSFSDGSAKLVYVTQEELRENGVLSLYGQL